MSPPGGTTSSFPNKLRRRTKTLVRNARKCTTCIGCGSEPASRYNVSVERPIGTISRTPSGRFNLTNQETAPIMHPCNDILELASRASPTAPRDRPPRDRSLSKDTASIFGSLSSFLTSKPYTIRQPTPDGSVLNYTYMTSSPYKNFASAVYTLPLDISSVTRDERCAASALRHRRLSSVSPPPYTPVAAPNVHAQKIDGNERTCNDVFTSTSRNVENSLDHQDSLRNQSCDRLDHEPAHLGPNNDCRKLTYPSTHSYLDVSQCTTIRKTLDDSDYSLIMSPDFQKMQTSPQTSSSYSPEKGFANQSPISPKLTHSNPSALKHGTGLDPSHRSPTINDNIETYNTTTTTKFPSNHSRDSQPCLSELSDYLLLFERSFSRFEDIRVDPRISRIGLHGLNGLNHDSNGKPSINFTSSTSLDLLSDIRYIHYSPRELLDNAVTSKVTKNKDMRSHSLTQVAGISRTTPEVSRQRFSSRTDSPVKYRSQLKFDDENSHEAIRTNCERTPTSAASLRPDPGTTNRTPSRTESKTHNILLRDSSEVNDNASYRNSNNTLNKYSSINNRPSPSDDLYRVDDARTNYDDGSNMIGHSVCDQQPNYRNSKDNSNSTASAYSSGFGSSNETEKSRFLTPRNSTQIYGRENSLGEESEESFSVFSLEPPPLKDDYNIFNAEQSHLLYPPAISHLQQSLEPSRVHKLDAGVSNLITEYRRMYGPTNNNESRMNTKHHDQIAAERRCRELRLEFDLYKQRKRCLGNTESSDITSGPPLNRFNNKSSRMTYI